MSLRTATGFAAALATAALLSPLAGAHGPNESNVPWIGSGPFYTNTTTYNRNCIWYAQGEWCNGWNYWNVNEVNRGIQFAKLLHGFENNNTIRGCVAPSAQIGWFYCWGTDVSMGGLYKRGQLLWWGSVGDNFVYVSDSHVWANVA